MPSERYAVYDPEDGLIECDTEEQAFRLAKAHLQSWREHSQYEGEWAEEVESLRVYRLIGETEPDEIEGGVDYRIKRLETDDV